MNEEQPHTSRRSCPCPRCTRRRKAYRVDYDRGIRRLTDASATREHLIWLSNNGVGRPTVAAALGFAEITLMRIYNGQTKHVHWTTERKIRTFTPAKAALIANGRTVDATATRLRYQALVALGYPQAYIARSTGRAHIGIDIGERVVRRRALQILRLCIQIGDTPGASAKAATQARNKGWRKPADYDGDLFYDPLWDGSEPEAPQEQLTAGEMHLREYDFLHRNTAAGIEQIAERLGITKGYLLLLISRRDHDNAEQLGLTG